MPPVVWTKREVGGVGGVGDGADTTGKGTMTSVWHIGSDVCGPTGHVHDGYVATMLDEGLARCCIGLLPHRVALTAELRIDYVAPVPAEAFVVLRAETTRIVGRKAWVEGRLETLEEEGVQPRVLARATALFVSPKSAGVSGVLLWSPP